MAWRNFEEDEEGKTAIHDLRQVYALELLQPTLKQIDLARKTSNFPSWFKLLSRDLLADLNQKLKIKEREELKNRIEETRNIIMKYPQEYLGKSKNPNNVEIIEHELLELEMYMKDLTEKHHLYGRKEEAELI